MKILACFGALLCAGSLGAQFPLIYRALMPAADCPGIEVCLILHRNGTFVEQNDYIERESFTEEGHYFLERKLLTTVSKQGDSSFYRVEKNNLRKLDRAKNRVKGPLKNAYILKKQNNEKTIDD